nr:hypothetical protein [Tanacetum cinerariifolium]
MFFVYGYGGTSKIYLYKTLSAALRSKGEIVLNVASSADSDLVELIRMSKLIIWDEDPMTHRHCYEAFDRTLQDICRTDPSTPSEKILSIRNGTIGGKNDGETTVEFPEDLLIPDSSDYIETIIEETYPQLIQNLYNPTYFQEKAILAPTYALVDMINDRMLELIPGDGKTYESSNSVGIDDVDTNINESLYTYDFLNSIKVAGLPQHILKLKIGAPVICMRNIDQRVGLCNETRLQILRMGIKIIEAKIIPGGNVGSICAIPHMVLSPTDTKMPFKFLETIPGCVMFRNDY